MLQRIYSSVALQPPLMAGIRHQYFKLKFLDCGLLQHALGFDWRGVAPDANIAGICNGKFAEQFVGNELITSRPDNISQSLYYWSGAKEGSEAEVDYLVKHEGLIAPVEVKSGKTAHLKSLRIYMEKYKSDVGFALSKDNISQKCRIISLPLYLAFRI